MPRKKVVQTDNMTLTSELPDDAIKDITGETLEPEEVKPKTLSQQQSAALAQMPDEKPSKKDIFEEPKAVVAADSKAVIDCLNFLKARNLRPSFGTNGNAKTCDLVDANGNSIMPFDELRNKSSVAYGDDKDRALINAVNSYKSTLKNESVVPIIPIPIIRTADGELAKWDGKMEEYQVETLSPSERENPYANAVPPKPKVPDWSEILHSDNTAQDLVNCLRKIIRQEIKAQMKDKEDIKSQIMDLVKKLENL